MSGDVHVRFCEGLGVRFPRPTRLIVLNEAHLLRVLTAYCAYYHESRTHLSLERNAPVPRQIESPERGKVIAIPHLGGLHHRYTRVA